MWGMQATRPPTSIALDFLEEDRPAAAAREQFRPQIEGPALNRRALSSAQI
jgi:hypothetical protein